MEVGDGSGRGGGCCRRGPGLVASGHDCSAIVAMVGVAEVGMVVIVVIVVGGGHRRGWSSLSWLVIVLVSHCHGWSSSRLVTVMVGRRHG